jgi:diguanylate cyclase
MTAHDPNFAREQRGILKWLGFGASSSEDDAGQDGEAAPPASESLIRPDPRERRRKQLVGDIGSFLVTHRLEVSPYTLAIAHDVITGADQRLARQIETRVEERKMVTLDWLEEVSRSAERGDGAAMLSALMTKLESSLDEFGNTTRAARSATHDYNSALEQHVDELAQVSKAGVVISELATIAKVMLERTREIEQEMTRSEMQTKSLQQSLDEARRSADQDHLTGLPNRRAFEATLKNEIAAAEANGEMLCVAFCDIDHFKRINDTHGHDAGDRVLKVVAQTLAKISDDRCHVARHGGEEFVILFRGKTLAEAGKCLDDARESMADRRLVNRANDVPFGKVTFSGGVADVFAYSLPRAALKAADDALYEAKADGRNKIVLAEIAV